MIKYKIMILKRKLYTDNKAPKYNFGEPEQQQSKGNDKAKKAGEIIGTAAIGTAGTIGGAELISRGAKKLTSIKAGKKARSEYKEYLKGQDYRRLKGLEQIEAQRKLERAPYEGGWFKKIWNRSKLKDADYIAEGKRSRLEGKLKGENLAKKRDLIAKRNVKISKAGKIGKRAGLIAGTALTAGAIAKKLYDKE